MEYGGKVTKSRSLLLRVLVQISVNSSDKHHVVNRPSRPTQFKFKAFSIAQQDNIPSVGRTEALELLNLSI